MSIKTANLALEGEGLRFVAKTGSGHQVVFDDREGDSGPGPAELLPTALAACTAMDVISILRKKRQQVTHYEVDVVGEQVDEHPHWFRRIDVTHVVEGPEIEVGAVQRAIELSATRYCGVGATISTGLTEVHHAYSVRSGEQEHQGEVIVTGPREEPDALGQRAAAAAEPVA